MSLFARSVAVLGLLAALGPVALAGTIDFTFTTIDYPGGLGTFLAGINNSGQIVGNYNDGAFLDSGGTFTAISDPLSSGGTHAAGINDAGQIVGYYFDGTGRHGFVDSGEPLPQSTTRRRCNPTWEPGQTGSITRAKSSATTTMQTDSTGLWTMAGPSPP